MAYKSNSTVEADRYLILGFLLVVFWIPLPEGSNLPWAWSFFEVCVFVLAISWLVLFALGRVKTTPAFRRAWPALLLFAMTFVLVILQLAPLPPSLIALLSPNATEIYRQTQTDAALSLDPSGTRAAALITLAYGALFAMTLLLTHRRGRLRALALVLVFSGVFQAAFDTLMTLSGLEFGFFVEKVQHKGAVAGTFVNSNYLAGYLEICIAVGVGLMLVDMSTDSATTWRENARRLLKTILGDKARVRVALIIMVIGLVLSRSRMGNMAFLSSLLVAGGFYVFVVRRVSVAIIAFLVSVLLIDILIIGNLFGIEKVAEEIRQTSLASEVARIDAGRDTLEIMRGYPLTGTGAGSFASIYPMFDSGRIAFVDRKYAHNDYLHFAAEFGLPGLAILAGIVVLSLWQATRAQLERHDRMMRGLGCGISMAIVALLIHSAVDFNLQIPANAATFVVVLAMGWSTRWVGRHSYQSPRSTREDILAISAEVISYPVERGPLKP